MKKAIKYGKVITEISITSLEIEYFEDEEGRLLRESIILTKYII